MQIFTEIEPLRAFLSLKRAERKTIGLVPTMGALHSGHLNLVIASRAENDITVGTIYVNPTQFNNPSDLEKYPRSIDADIGMLEGAGCDVLFCPDNQVMYAHNSTVKFDFGTLDKVLEGEFRPGHFSGVALVVSKLFNITVPDKAYFGQKDFQQYAIISKLVEELKFGIQLRCVATMREKDGLAMSSRNLRLNHVERSSSVILYQSLSFARKALLDGESMATVKSEVMKMWDKVSGARLEYFALANRENLLLLDHVTNSNPSVVLIAGYVGEVRLIDNLIVE